MTLAETCYRLTRDFPREELFAMSSQIKRSASSIPANIAEGHGRENTQSFIQYLRIVQGSLKELEMHLLLSQRVGLLEAIQLTAPIDQRDILGKKIRSLIRSLQQRTAKR